MFARRLAFVLPLIPACTTASPPHAAQTPKTTPITSVTQPAPTPSTPLPSEAPQIPDEVETTPSTPTPMAEEFAPGEAKLALGRDTVITVHWTPGTPEQDPTLMIERLQEGKTVRRREGWKEITHFDWSKMQPCESWGTQMVNYNLGNTDGVRISLVCRTGEDYFTSTEFALILDSTTLKTLWAGLADRTESIMDSCITTHHIDVRSPSAEVIEKKISKITRWVDQPIASEVKLRLKQACKVGVDVHIETEARPKTK